jgi:hypothetical protein
VNPLMKHVALALLALCVSGCSRSEPESRFTADQAQETARRFQEALSRGDTKALIALARTPFRYKEASRIWPDGAALEANLAKEVPRIRHQVTGLDRYEAFSVEDLREGKWPRGRVVEEAARAGEIAAVGLERDGWIVRVFAQGTPGYVLVLNREGRDLAVQMLDI